MRTVMMVMASAVCLAIVTGCNQNAAEIQKLSGENAELKAKVAALEGENAKLVAQLAEAQKTPAELKVPDHIKPIEVGGKGLASYHLKLSIVGNKVVAEDIKRGGVIWANALEGHEVSSFGEVSGQPGITVTTDKFKYRFRLDNGDIVKKDAVQ